MMSDYNDPWGSVYMGASHLSFDETSNPKPTDTFSEFGDDACGEPLNPQHIHIDFTPNDDDNDIVQKKICAFWQFINNQPNIQNLKVAPGKCEAHAKPSKRKVVKPEETVAVLNKTACEMLDMVGKKETPIFWNGTMHNHWPVKKPAPSEAKKLCTKLQEWDDNHLESMDPPGHAPLLQPCVIQNKSEF